MSTVSWRKKLRAFQRWFKLSVFERERLQLAEQTRLLQFSSYKQSHREVELQAQLDEQRASNAKAQSRVRALTRDLEQLHGAGSGQQQPSVPRRDEAAAEQLRSEREKSVLAAAKYNTLLSRTAKEQQELRDKLAAAENRLVAAHGARQPSAQSSTATSADFSGRRSAAAHLPSDRLLPGQFLGESSDQMLLRAQQRVSERRNANAVRLRCCLLPVVSAEVIIFSSAGRVPRHRVARSGAEQENSHRSAPAAVTQMYLFMVKILNNNALICSAKLTHVPIHHTHTNSNWLTLCRRSR